VTDWDLGQKLIEQGACSLDQVREVLSLKERMGDLGAMSKPFPRSPFRACCSRGATSGATSS
jgi:hypothetical protein